MVEIITGLGILGLVVFLAASVYFAHFRLFSNQVTSIDVASQNKLAIDEITNQIRESVAVAVSCCSGPTETTSGTVLVLQLWGLDATGEPVSTITDYIVYKQDTTKLVKRIVPGAGSTRQGGTRTITGYLDTTNGLQFSYLPDMATAAQVTTTIQTSSRYGDKTQTVSQSSQATLRNK